ncbi:AEC family transporter [Oceanithermus sp.]
MGSAGVLLGAVAPVALMVATGYLAVRVLHLERGPLVRLTLYVLVPFLVFDQLWRNQAELGGAVRLAAAFALASAGFALLGCLAGRVFSLPQPARVSLTATTAFPNTGNMGLSVAFFALGEAGLERATIIFVVATILLFSFGPALFKGGSLKEQLKMTLRLPLIWAVILGLLANAVNLKLPLNLGGGVHMLAQGAIPMLLLSLGMQIAESRFAVSAYDLAASLLRVLGGPLVAYLAGLALGLSGPDLVVLLLISGMPAAVNTYLMAAEFGGDAERTARVVVLSTLLSFVTLPLVLGLATRVAGAG